MNRHTKQHKTTHQPKINKREASLDDLDDFGMASDELSHLQWIPLTETKNFDLPFVTQVVMAEINGNLENNGPPKRVPFFKNTTEESLLYYIGEKGI